MNRTNRINQGFTIVQHNVRSWYNKRFELYNTYRLINPDIILLNDTGDCYIAMPGYRVYKSCKTKDKVQGCGTAIAIRDNIAHYMLDDFETDLIAVKLITVDGPIIIATDYIAPREGYVHYPDYIKLFSPAIPVYLLGDLNAHHPAICSKDSQSNPVGRQLVNLIERKNLEVLGPNFPTRTDYRSSTIPDKVIANQHITYNYHIKPGPQTSSDHIPVVMRISNNLIQIPIMPRRQYTKADWEGFKEHLESIPSNTTDALTTQELDLAATQWNNQVKEAIDKYVPTITSRTIPGVKPNEAILEARAQISFMQQIISTFGASAPVYQAINHNRRLLKEEYQKLQKETWDGIIANLQGEKDVSKFFSGIKRYMGNNKRNISKISDNHGNFLYTPREQEPLFRSYWKKIFHIDIDDIEYDPVIVDEVERFVSTEYYEELNPLPASDLSLLSDDFPPITRGELTDHIRKLKHKAPGPTGIGAHAMKNLPPNMIDNLVNIFNHSMALGYFPACYKEANMIFIPKIKDGSKSTEVEVANHRPISLTEVPGKMLDQKLNQRFNHHLITNNLFHKDQHGFRPRRGCHTALAVFHETISKAVQEGKNVGVVLRDVSKAFDKVWTDGLKYKLIDIGLHPQLLRCLSSYITDRKAHISIAGHVGPAFQLESGVPQGGCLSPSLFNFFTKDLPDPTSPGSEITTIIYADDVTQIVTNPNPSPNLLQLAVSRVAEEITEFEKDWLIKTNTSKFKYVANTTNLHRGAELRTMFINDVPIEKCKVAKCLGLTFNLKTYATHTDKAKANCSRKLMKLRRFRNLSLKRKRHLYLAFVRPSLIYPALPMHVSLPKNMGKLQAIQNRATKFIVNPDTYHITAEELHERAKLEPLNIVLHRQAQKTWLNIKEDMPELYDKLSQPYQRRVKYLPSSRVAAEADAPEPKYKAT